jgi:MoaA/NifB/PqqE/SkfB family radical SAM enzyme
MLPIGLSIYITSKCQLQCNHCFLVADKSLNKFHLDYNTILKILDDAQTNKVHLMPIAGGDPLLHPEFFTIIEEILKRKIVPLCSLTGIGIDHETAKRIKSVGIPSVQVSLDGANEETNLTYRGKGVFKQVVEAIKIMRENDIMVNLASCFDKNNFHEVEDLLELAYSLGVSHVKTAIWDNSFHNQQMKLTHSIEKKEIHILEQKVSKFNQKVRKSNFAFLPAPIERFKNPPCVIMANGDIRIGEMGRKIGNVNINIPSLVYSEYIKERRDLSKS